MGGRGPRSLNLLLEGEWWREGVRYPLYVMVDIDCIAWVYHDGGWNPTTPPSVPTVEDGVLNVWHSPWSIPWRRAP